MPDMKILLGSAIEIAESLKRTHYECEDCWYSCPASGDCCKDNGDTDCNCGADYVNEKIDKLVSILKACGA